VITVLNLAKMTTKYLDCQSAKFWNTLSERFEENVMQFVSGAKV